MMASQALNEGTLNSPRTKRSGKRAAVQQEQPESDSSLGGGLLEFPEEETRGGVMTSSCVSLGKVYRHGGLQAMHVLPSLNEG